MAHQSSHSACSERSGLTRRLDPWQAEITYVSQRVTENVRTLYRLKNFLPPNTKISLMQFWNYYPIIDYGGICYCDLNADLLNKLDGLLSNCIRYNFNLEKYEQVSAYRS